MLRLREAFSQKIHLHIKQDLLQKLWDKYVPAESSEYENIQLIYLDGGARQALGQSRQIQMLISLVLKNRIMRMRLEEYPVKTAFAQERGGNSLQRMEKYYLMQLRCCDFVMFRKVSKYLELLTHAEADGRRCRNWQRDDQAIEEQRDRYRLFSLFSSEIKEFLEEHTMQAMRTLEREMLYALSEKEYRQLAERLIWQEKEAFLSFLESCNEAQCRKIIRQLERTGIRKSMKLFMERSSGEALAKAADKLGRKEFCLFYRQAVCSEGADEQLVIWKKKKEKMLRYVKKQGPEKVRQLWAQMEKFAEQKEWAKDEAAGAGEHSFAVFSEKLVQLGEQYFREVIKDFREQAVSMLRTGRFKAIADMADFLWQGLDREPAEGIRAASGERVERNFREEGRLASETEICRITDLIESELKSHRKQIEQREAKVFVKYQKEYQKILGANGFGIPGQKDLLRIAEEIFRNQHEEKLTREEIRSICEWGRVFAESEEMSLYDAGQKTELAYLIREINRHIKEKDISGKAVEPAWREGYQKDYREASKIQELLSYIHELKEGKREEFIGNLADAALIQSICEWGRVFAESEEMSLYDAGQKTELAYLVTEINRHIKEQDISGEIIELAWREDYQKGYQEASKIQELLSYIHELKEGKREEFIGNLADAILIWQQVNLSAQSLLQVAEKEVGDGFLQIAEEEFAGESEQIGEKGTAEIPYDKLWEWGKALLFYPKHGQGWADADILPAYQEDMQISDSARQKDIQTDTIRRQIEAAKDRNSLQRLIMQINGTNNSEQNFRLVYADSQLNTPPIQSLLRYMRKLDEEQYGTLIKGLSQVTRVQWMQHTGQEIEEADAVAGKHKQDRRIVMEHKWASQWLAAAYPKLALRIREFEGQRHKIIQEDIRKLENNMLFQDVMTDLEEGFAYGIRKMGRLQLLSHREGRENGRDFENAWKKNSQAWELQYSVQNARISEEEQLRDKTRMQEQANQLKSAQEQIDKKLQEVELQLKKVETAAKAQENVGELADKVKRQLYEELHVEKLRRGLV